MNLHTRINLPNENSLFSGNLIEKIANFAHNNTLFVNAQFIVKFKV